MSPADLLAALRAAAQSGDTESAVMLPVIEGWLRGLNEPKGPLG